MDEEDEDFDEEPDIRPIKFTPLLPLAATCDLLSDLFIAFGGYFNNLSLALCSHFRFREQQELVHEQAARELETLIEE